jgi:hypothetical protein
VNRLLRAVKALSLLAGAAIIAGLLYYYYGPLVVVRVYAPHAAQGTSSEQPDSGTPNRLWHASARGASRASNEFLVNNRCRLGCGLSPFGVTYYRRDRPQFLPGLPTYRATFWDPES